MEVHVRRGIKWGGGRNCCTGKSRNPCFQIDDSTEGIHDPTPPACTMNPTPLAPLDVSRLSEHAGAI